MIESGDEFDVTLGHDADFDNVSSQVIIPLDTPRKFSGKTGDYLDTGIKLFDEDKSFVLAVDFEFGSTTEGGVLVSCAIGDTGFRLQYNGGGKVSFGGTQTPLVSSTLTREMLVIRKRKGDTNLYVYASNKTGSKQFYNRITRTLPTEHNSTLAFGCAWDSNDQYAANLTAGTIHWAKIWMDDLGDEQCKTLAAWPKETLTVQAAGSEDYIFRMFTKTGTGNYSACCFLLKNLMNLRRGMNSTNVNQGGWAATAMREWLNTRVLKALPLQWQAILQKVDVKSTIGNLSTTEFATSQDYLWLPCCKEVRFSVSSAGYSNEGNGTFNLFTDNASRIKYLDNGNGAACSWWLRSPLTDYTTLFYSVYLEGYDASYGASYSYGVCFGFCI